MGEATRTDERAEGTGAATGGREAPRGDARWSVRAATADDVAAAAGAIAELLAELGGGAPAAAELEAATRELVEDARAGALFVAVAGGAAAGGAEAGGELVGVLAASWQSAPHVPGRYATIQDLWVARAWRSDAIGAALVEALCARARALGMARVEVGLPRASFAGIAATARFYGANGFEGLGERMRRRL